MFAETIDTYRVLEQLKHIADMKDSKYQSPLYGRAHGTKSDEADRLALMVGMLFKAQKRVFDQNKDGCVFLDNIDQRVKHTNFEVHILNDPKPEVFMVNLNYANYRNSS